MAQTLFEKVWDAHCIETDADGNALIYIDRHIIHEVTSAQAFEGLADAGRKPRRKGSILATADHQVPTTERALGLDGFKDLIAREQVVTLERNCDSFGIRQFRLKDVRQGIVHVVGPEQGATLPGMTLVCGDSHTSTHGAFAVFAQGVGTSEVEHVLVTQTLVQPKPKTLQIKIDGKLSPAVTAKDVILYVIGVLGGAGATGYVIEYCGEVIERLSMEARMTICNMSIEAGARAGMIPFDSITEAYLKDKPFAPKGEQWQQALKYWQTLQSDADAMFDKTIVLDGAAIVPFVTWGTKPDQVVPVTALVPDPALQPNAVVKNDYTRALFYMGLTAQQKITDIKIDKIFIGSCTNGRLEDIQHVAHFVVGKKVPPSVHQAMVVPGSGLVKVEAERLGLDKILTDAGFEWRDPGCSMCNAMNPDRLLPGERCASTSNRNFEGRQGQLGRTHLMSPLMAAAAALTGHITDVRDLFSGPPRNSEVK